jgi:hypothetical protein
MALACQQQSLAIRRSIGDRYGQACCMRELGPRCGSWAGWRTRGGTGKRRWRSSNDCGPATPAMSGTCCPACLPTQALSRTAGRTRRPSGAPEPAAR